MYSVKTSTIRKPASCEAANSSPWDLGVCEVYETKDQHLRLAASLSLLGLAPLAVLATNVPRQFALLGTTGNVSLYEL